MKIPSAVKKLDSEAGTLKSKGDKAMRRNVLCFVYFLSLAETGGFAIKGLDGNDDECCRC